MNKIITTLLLLSFTFALAQEKIYNLTNKTTYAFHDIDTEPNDFLEYYSSNENPNIGILKTTDSEKGRLIINNESYPITVDLTGKITFITDSYPYYEEVERDNTLIPLEDFETLQKIDKTESVNNTTCNYYKFRMSLDKDQPMSFNVCIDEKNNTNNIGFLNEPNKKAKIAGLILKLYPDNEEGYLQLSHNEKINVNIKLDYQQQLALYNEAIDKRIAEIEQWQEDVQDSEYEYGDVVESAVEDAVADAAVDAVDASADYYPEDIEATTDEIAKIAEPIYYYPNYESLYKEEELEEPLNLAIVNLIEEEHDSSYTLKAIYILKSIPQHCSKLKESFPNIKDKKFALHLQNYVGQQCDLYLYDTENSSVYYRGTIDSYRNSGLYIINHLEDLSKKEQIAVKKYLNQLD